MAEVLGSDEAVAGLLRTLGVASRLASAATDAAADDSDVLGEMKDEEEDADATVEHWINQVRSALANEGCSEVSLEWRELNQVAKSAARGRLDEALGKAAKLARKLRPFDIGEFLELYGKTEKMSDSLRGQNCWLFAGPTGAGKSTTIHYLAGSEMKRDEGSEHIYPAVINNESLRALPEDAIRCGQNLSTSETRYISAVSEDLSEIEEFKDLDLTRKDSQIQFVDSPGFEDSRSPELDLANGLGMVRALRKADRVKLVCVFSQWAFGSRMKGLKKLSGTLAGILTDFNEILSDRVGCLITRAANTKTRVDFKNDFKKALNEEEKKDTDKDEAFAELMYCLSKKKIVVEIVRPLVPELRADVLSSLLDIPWIEDPEESFREFISTETMSSLRDQIQRYQSSLSHLCKNENLNQSNCQIISRWLKKMRDICGILRSHDRLKQSLENCEQIVIDAWNDKIAQSKSILEGVLEVSPKLFRSQLKEFEQFKRDLEGADLSLLKGKVKDLATLDVYVNDSLKSLLTYLDDLPHCGRRVTKEQWQSAVDKILELRELYPDSRVLAKLVESKAEEWEDAAKSKMAACKRAVQSEEWERLRALPGSAEYYNELCKELSSGGSGMRDITGAIAKSISSRLRTIVEDKCPNIGIDFTLEADLSPAVASPVSSIARLDGTSVSSRGSVAGDAPRKIRLEAEKPTDSEISAMVSDCNDTLRSCLHTLTETNEDVAFPLPLKIEEVVRRTLANFHYALVSYAEGLLFTARDFLDSDERWNDAELYLNTCAALRTVNEVSVATSDEFMEARIQVDEKLSKLSMQAQRMVEECMRMAEDHEGEVTLDYTALAECVDSLNKAGCDEKDDRVKVIGKRVIELLESVKERIDALQISLEKSDDLLKLGHVIAQLHGLSRVSKNMPEVATQIRDLSGMISSSIERILTRIHNDYNLDRYSLDNVRTEKRLVDKFLSFSLRLRSKSSEVALSIAGCDGDLDAILAVPLRQAIDEDLDKLREIDRREKAGPSAIEAELKQIEQTQSVIVGLIKMRQFAAVEEELKSAGFSDADDINGRMEELKKDISDFEALIAGDRATVEKDKAEKEVNLALIEEYIENEQQLMVEMDQSTLINYRMDLDSAKIRKEQLEELLNSGDEYNFPELNLVHAMHAALFVERCNRVPWRKTVVDLREMVQHTQESFTKYIRANGMRWDQTFEMELDECFAVRKHHAAMGSGGARPSSLLLSSSVSKKSLDVDPLSPIELHTQNLGALVSQMRQIFTMDMDRDEVDFSGMMFGQPSDRKVSEVLEKINGKYSELKMNTQKWKSTRVDLCDRAANHCQALSRIDNFLRWASSVTGITIETFADLALTLDEGMEGIVSESTKQCIAAFDDRNFRKLQSSLDELKRVTETRNQRSYDYVCGMVMIRLKQLFTDALMSVLQLDEGMTDSDMFKLSENLEMLRQAMVACEDHIPDTSKSEVEAKEVQIKSELHERLVTLLDGASKAAQNHFFRLSEKRLKNITRMIRFFASGVGGMIEAEGFKELTDRQAEVRSLINDELESLLTKFQAADLTDYRRGHPYANLQPKRLFEEMSEMWAEFPVYRTTWENIRSSISDKMMHALSVVAAEDGGIAVAVTVARPAVSTSSSSISSSEKTELKEEKTEEKDDEKGEKTEAEEPTAAAAAAAVPKSEVRLFGFKERTRILRLLKSVMRYLPDEMAAMMKEEIAEVEETMQGNKEIVNKEIEQFVASEDWISVVAMIDELGRSDPLLQKKTIMQLEKMAAALRAEIESILTKDAPTAADATQLSMLLSRLFRIMSFFNSSSCPVGAEKMRSQLAWTFDKVIDTISTRMTQASDQLNKIHDCNKKDLNTFTNLIAFLAPLQPVWQSNPGIPADFIERCNKFRDFVHKYVTGLNKGLTRSMKDLDSDGLKSVLQVSERMDNYNDLYLLLSAIISGYHKMELPNHKKMCEEIHDCIVTNILNPIIDEGLSSKSIFSSDKERRKTLELLSQSLLKLDTFELLYKKYLSSIVKVTFDRDLLDQCKDKLQSDTKSLMDKVKSSVLTGELNSSDLTTVESIMESYRLMSQDKKCLIPDKYLGQSADSIWKEMNEIICLRVEKTYKACDGLFSHVDVVAKNLIDLQLMGEMVSTATMICNEQIDRIMNEYESDKAMRKLILPLSSEIQVSNPDVGARLVQSKKSFESIARTLRTKRMVELSIDDVLRKLHGYKIKLDTKKLKSMYQTIDKVYNDCLMNGLKVTKYEQIDYDSVVLNKLFALARDVQSMQKKALNKTKGGMFHPSESSWFAFKSNPSKQASKIRDAYWPTKLKKIIPQMLGYCFALWTLKRSQPYFNDDGGSSGSSSSSDSSKSGYLLQPRVAQVVSILCLLGLDSVPDSEHNDYPGLINNLVEIGTGEGKSLTLAMSAMILALIGFDVSCACFSELLSARDFNDYCDLFEMAQVKTHIHYGTFNALFERQINRDCDVREEVTKILDDPDSAKAKASSSMGSADTSSESKNNKPSILLIDEVDVFFQKDFFGSLYRQSVVYHNDGFNSFIRWVYDEVIQGSSKITLPILESSSEFESMCSMFHSDWRDLLLEAAKDVVAGAEDFETGDYEVVDGRIGYKFQDTISFKISKGYRTMFAYIHECEMGSVTKEKVDEMLGLFIKIASFSYAEIPSSFYSIVGVTGTLKTLTQPEKDIMETGYAIVKHVYMPSLFGDSQLTFAKNEDTVCVETAYYRSTLNTSVMTARNKSAEVTRPILIIFETKRDLVDFHESDAFQSIRDDPETGKKIQLLTEEHSEAEKKRRIKLASQQGQITLSTSSFGRGVDYQVYDEQINSAGGMHVEAAFFSPSNAEEVQFRGRTARQGAKGSFHMTIDTDVNLEKFGVTPTHVQKWKDNSELYDRLSEFRDRRFVEEYNEGLSFVSTLKEIHKESEKMALALRMGDFDMAKKLLLERNMGAMISTGATSASGVGSGVARMVVCIDATGSMSSLLNQAKSVVGMALPKLKSFLTDQGYDPSQFQIMITYYRNYNAPYDELVVSSSYSSDVSELVSFMQPVGANYGMGNESVESGFQHIAQLSEAPHFVLVIGDMPANTPSDVRSNRSYRSEDYWNEHGFPSTTWSEELDKLIAKNVKVNCFYLTSYAHSNFADIAARSGGVCKSLDVSNEDQSVKDLIGAVADQILMPLAGGSRQLIEEFRKVNPDVPYFL